MTPNISIKCKKTLAFKPQNSDPIFLTILFKMKEGRNPG